MNLKVYTLSGSVGERVAKPFYVTPAETTSFSVTPSSNDGVVIAVQIGNSTANYRLGWGYVDEESAQAALDEFMDEQGFEQIKREEEEAE